MIGWKRIVVTVGKKIGKSHLIYAQGVSAELVAMTTIAAADMFSLPVLLLLAFLIRWLGMGKKCEPEKPEAPAKVKPIHLGQLSQVWTGEEKEQVIRLEELAKNWCKQPAVKVNEPERERPFFSHPGINEFYRTLTEAFRSLPLDAYYSISHRNSSEVPMVTPILTR